MPAVASDGEFWIERVLSTIDQLEKDTKHVSPLDDVDEEELELRQKSRQIAERLRSVCPLFAGKQRQCLTMSRSQIAGPKARRVPGCCSRLPCCIIIALTKMSTRQYSRYVACYIMNGDYDLCLA